MPSFFFNDTATTEIYTLSLHDALPISQGAPRLLAVTLYRFEVNVRMTAMVGFVGAGGIGDAIDTAISLFHGPDLVALLGVLFGAVVADRKSTRLNSRHLVISYAVFFF